MTLSDRFLSASIKSWGGLVSLISITFAVLGFFVVPESKTVPLNWALVIALMLIALIIIAFRAAHDANLDSRASLPKVRTVIDPPHTYSDASALLLLDPTDLLSHDSVVSVYYLDAGIERLSGIGKVVNVQNDKKIQVILFIDAEFSDKIQSLKSNTPEDLSKIIVKPSVPSFYLGIEQ